MARPITSTILCNLNETPIPFDSYYESQITEFYFSTLPPDPFAAQEELCTRDHLFQTYNGLLTHRGQTVNLLDPESFFSLTGPTDENEFLPGGVHTPLAGPNVIDRAEPCQWTNDDGWDASLLPPIPQYA
jgi:hypothetical protein